jgi:predicted flap endonuclease-1-like 5' DNA nuclease
MDKIMIYLHQPNLIRCRQDVNVDKITNALKGVAATIPVGTRLSALCTEKASDNAWSNEMSGFTTAEKGVVAKALRMSARGGVLTVGELQTRAASQLPGDDLMQLRGVGEVANRVLKGIFRP